jgi:hypothetical protein
MVRQPARCASTSGKQLLDPLPCKAISPAPKLANWTPLVPRIDPFLVGTTDDTVGHCDRPHLVLLDEFQYLLGDAAVSADVTLTHLPVAQVFHLCILKWYDGNDLCRAAQVWTVEGNRRNRPTPHSPSGSLAQAFDEVIFHRRAPLKQNFGSIATAERKRGKAASALPQR